MVFKYNSIYATPKKFPQSKNIKRKIKKNSSKGRESNFIFEFYLKYWGIRVKYRTLHFNEQGILRGERKNRKKIIK